MTFTIDRAASAKDHADAAMLFEAYAASLPITLDYQNFAGELATLPGDYAPPGGALFLARDLLGSPLGCVAIRPLAADGCCEMKRLFLCPASRGQGLGRALAEIAIGAARAIGYGEIRLDTLPSMAGAMALYADMGFQRIEAYYRPTPAGTVFMTLKL